MINRKDILLRAAFDILRKAQNAHYVIEVLHETAFYDDADCDGSCLIEDIAHTLNIDADAMPLENPTC